MMRRLASLAGLAALAGCDQPDALPADAAEADAVMRAEAKTLEAAAAEAAAIVERDAEAERPEVTPSYKDSARARAP